MKIAVSGHRGLPGQTAGLVDAAIRRNLAESASGALVGFSCLADGADQIFAQAVIDAGGELRVIVPAAEYRDGLPEESRARYDELLGLASDVHRLDRVTSDSEAHMAASEEMLRNADALIAVWDGEPARGYGGTADVVDLAKRMNVAVSVVWPPGSERGA